MKYLLELKEFDTGGRIDYIVKRILATGYISTSMSKELDEVTGIKNIVPKLLQKVGQINQFYNRSNSNFFDDVLLEFFDDSPYTYKVGTGVYLPDKTYFVSSDKIKTNIPIPADYDSSDNKEAFLLSFLLDFVKSLNVKVWKKTSDYQEGKKKETRWIQQLRDRDIEYVNYFKYVLDIQPCIYLNVTHRRREEYWEMDAEEFVNLEGWNSEQYCSNWKKDSVTERIKKRFSYFPYLGECVAVETSGWTDTYTFRSWMEGEEVVKNPNPVLIKGYINIKFKLKN
jgi:hypothetical protein